MPKINLNEVRGFADSITATFSFVKQEFKPLICSLAALVVPLIFVDLFLKSFVLRSMFSAPGNSPEDSSGLLFLTGTTFVSALMSVAVYFWLAVVVVSYIKVYNDKFQDGDASKIKIPEVWQAMKACMGRMFLGGFVLIILLAVAFLFLIIPGIYFSVAFVFSLFYIGIQHKSLDESLSGSMKLVKGKWWYMFGYLLIIQMVIGILAYIFNIPYMFLLFSSVFTGSLPDTYGITIGFMFSSLGQYIAQSLLLVGIGVKYFSLLEETEHGTLFRKIGQMGENTQIPESEGER